MTISLKTNDDIIADVLRHEGGWVDRTDDRGGPTNRGITLETYSLWLGRPASRDELRAIPESTARDIYLQRYIKAPGLDKIEDVNLRARVVDAAVNHGPPAAIKMLQEVLGVIVDGRLGPITLALANDRCPRETCILFLAQRLRFYGRLMKTMPQFAEGWMNRMADQLIAEA